MTTRRSVAFLQRMRQCAVEQLRCGMTIKDGRRHASSQLLRRRTGVHTLTWAASKRPPRESRIIKTEGLIMTSMTSSTCGCRSVADWKLRVVMWVLILSPSVVGVALDPGSLVAGWTFDAGAGKVARDLSAHGNDAAFFGDPKWVGGKVDQALQFNGSTDYVAAPDSPSLDIDSDQLSIVAWIHGGAWPGANHIVRKIADQGTGHIYMMRVQPEMMRVYLKTDAGETQIDGATSLPNNEWIHVALAYDGAEARVYVDGEIDGSAAMSGQLAQSDNEVRIGRGEPAGYFEGMIDELAIFASALTEGDVQEIRDHGLSTVLSVAPQGKLSQTWAAIKQNRASE